jgi:hypothetical protein
MALQEGTYQLKKYIHPKTREMAFANASNSLSAMVS